MYNNKFNFVAIFALFSMLIFTGCAHRPHHRDVRPGVDGLHRVVARSQEKSRAQRSALRQAEHFCEQSQQSIGVVSEKTEYTGTMDESTRDTISKASMAAMIIGGPRHYGHPGGPSLHTAGTVGHVMTSGEDYVSEMLFKCQ